MRLRKERGACVHGSSVAWSPRLTHLLRTQHTRQSLPYLSQIVAAFQRGEERYPALQGDGDFPKGNSLWALYDMAVG